MMSSGEKKPVGIIDAGGTIAKGYNALTGEVDFSAGSNLEAMLRQANLNPELIGHIGKVFLMDSLDMTTDHRIGIRDAALRIPEKHLVITHGTDTMPETAQLLGKDPGLEDKTIILTGAMRPPTVDNSDAMFNLGGAFAYAQSLDNGVYIVMNGLAFPHHDVMKDKALGRFVAPSEVQFDEFNVEP